MLFFLCDNCRKKSLADVEIVYFWTCPRCNSQYDYRESIREDLPDDVELQELREMKELQEMKELKELLML